jgi:MFS family permease
MPASAAPRSPWYMRALGRALRHRNYRLYFFGQGISLIGTWLTRFAMSYETYALSHSAFQLGLVAFFSQAPTALIGPVAGVFVDRWDRHRTIIITQILAALQSAALAAFALTGTMTVAHLVVLGAVQGVINAFDMPARQSFVRQMVDDRADLPNAIALNSSLVNIARLIGPVVAATLVTLVGFGWCFAIDAVSYLAVVASLLAMRVPPQKLRTLDPNKRIVDEIRDGVAYVRSIPLVRALLLLLAASSIFGGAVTALLPAIAQGSFHASAHGLGWLLGATGAGALVGVLYLASRDSTAGLTSLVRNCAVGLALGMIALELATTLWLAIPILFVIGGSLIVQWAATNTLVQSIVDDDKLGRVMSLQAVVFFAGSPIGALVEGTIAEYLGPIHTLALAGLGCLACALALRSQLRPVEPAPAVSSAA